VLALLLRLALDFVATYNGYGQEFEINNLLVYCVVEQACVDTLSVSKRSQ
jgi:hypothetical protein